MKKIISVLVLSFIISMSSQSALASSASVVDLGSAEDFVILSKTGISTTGSTKVVGDIGISPAEATYITGFGLILPTASAFATSSIITGKVYAPSYANPTPSNISTAIGDMQTAYTDAQGRAADVTELGAGNIGGLTLASGVYKWGTGVTIPTDVILSGSSNDIWIFQIAQNLDISSSKSIVLSGGAKANNIYWVVAGQTTIGTGATFNGTILDKTAIVLNTGAVLNGRALAQTAVTLDASTVTLPSGKSSNSNPEPVEIKNTHKNSGSIPNATPDTDDKDDKDNNDNEVATTTIHSNEEGCSNGNKFNTSNGSVCVNNIVINELGCSAGYLFNVVNGHICNNNSTVKHNLGLYNLRHGSNGENVKDLQRFLITKLNTNLVVDGKLGSKTIMAVKKYQKENNLVVDGIVGSLTKSKIYENK